MRSIPATEFKDNCLTILDEVESRRESFVITKRGQPVVQLTAVSPSAKDTREADSIFGFTQVEAEILGDIVGPIIGEEEWI